MARPKKKSRKHSTRGKAQSYPRGTFEANERGFGFVKTDTGEYFIPESKTRDAMDGDLVEIAPVHTSDRKKAPGASAPKPGRRGMGRGPRGGKRDEARVVRVLDHRHNELIGRYEVAEPFGIVVPDDPRIRHDIFTLRENNPDIPDEAYVRVRILEYPTRKSAATGEIVEVFEDNAADLSIERVIARYNLETEFSEGALSQASDAVLDVEGALAGGYRDIRGRFLMTIDPTDAKDFDDALSIEETAPGEFRLGVHIADVSAYVEWASSIDLDARKRATSVYLADRVIPMLPPKLSEDLCSLRPGEDRLCMTCDLVLDKHANLLDCEMYPAVMNSKLRLTYDQAQSMLDGGSEPEGIPSGVAEKLATLSHLAKERQRNREARGGIEFRTKEAKVELDENGRPIGIAVREKTDATELVEEAMIFANEAVATYLEDHEKPCAYRVHEPPAADSLSALIPTLQEFKWFTTEMALDLPTGNPHVIQHILDECAGRAEDEMVTMLLLRAMMRAQYSPENDGHYGLGLRAYCHFTSPIRRYPDLIVHRMLKAALGFKQPKMGEQAKALKWLCEHSSEMERTAEAASYDSQKAKMVEYMAPFVGQDFEAIISGVVSYGLYVRLDNCVEGLVPVQTLGSEYFAYNESRHSLRGVETNTQYRLGQRVRVRLVEADTDLSRIDFKLI